MPRQSRRGCADRRNQDPVGKGRWANGWALLESLLRVRKCNVSIADREVLNSLADCYEGSH